MKYNVNFDQVAERAAKVARDVLRLTAIDVAKSAKSSIKAGGKTLASKNYATSRPGEPPRSHKGTLKNAIRYRDLGGAFIIGPERIGTSRALKALEKGGQGAFVDSLYSDAYAESRRKKRPGIRPRAKKPYRVRSQSRPKGVLVRDYLYFKSSVSRERAIRSAAFQEWARRQKRRFERVVDVAARPFMRPALAKEIVKIGSRFNRLSKTV